MDCESPNENVERRSLREESHREATRYKWYESERAGCDQGEWAIRQWVHRHWPGFLRSRWIEHMLGVRFWIELDRREFGLLQQDVGAERCIIESIVERLQCGAENLDIIRWSRCEKSPGEQKQVRHVLYLINVNGHRMQCYFGDEEACPGVR